MRLTPLIEETRERRDTEKRETGKRETRFEIRRDPV